MSLPSVNHELLTPVNFIKRSVEVYPDKLAVVNGNKRYTYRELYARINRLASALKKLGIGRDDKVAFISPNTGPMLEAHFAVPMIGAVLVTVNIRLSAPEVSYILNHSDTKICFVDNEFVPTRLPFIKAVTRMVAASSQPSSWQEYMMEKSVSD